jgi:hypothetical protein
MICPSCKGENPAHAGRCGHCGAILESPPVGKAVDSHRPGTPLDGGDKPKPLSESRPLSRLDRPDDRTIDGVAPSAGTWSKDGPGVSILSKTPSGSIPMDDRTMDSAEARQGRFQLELRPPPGQFGQWAERPGGTRAGMDFGRGSESTTVGRGRDGQSTKRLTGSWRGGAQDAAELVGDPISNAGKNFARQRDFHKHLRIRPRRKSMIKFRTWPSKGKD